MSEFHAHCITTDREPRNTMYSVRWLWFVFGLIMWRWTLAKASSHLSNSIPTSGEGDVNAQLAAILQRLDALDDRLDQLARQTFPGDATQVLQDLQGVCNELNGGRIKPPTHAPPEASTTTKTMPRKSHTCPKSSPSSQFRVTQVMKEETNTTYTLTLCYVGPAEPTVYDEDSPSGQEALIQHPEFGVVTAQVSKPTDNVYSDLSLSLNVQDQFASIRFMLAPDSPKELKLPQIQVKAKPGRDLVYKAGRDIDISFIVNAQDDQNIIDRQENYTTLLIKSTNEEHVIYQIPLISDDIEVPEDIEMPRETLGIKRTETVSGRNKVSRVHIPYSADRAAGRVVYTLYTSMNCSNECLVSYYLTAGKVTFYPRGQSSPYPDHFIGFMKQKPTRRGMKEDQVDCFVGNRVRECSIRCSVGGDQPSVNVSKVYSQGQSSSYRYRDYPPYDHHASAYMKFDNVTMGDAGVYMCRARSGADGPVITKMYTMTVSMVADILRDLTNFTTLDDGSLMAVCTAQGIPTPNVTFGLLNHDFYEYSQLVFDKEDYNITVKQLDSITSQATFRLRDWKKFDYDETNSC